MCKVIANKDNGKDSRKMTSPDGLVVRTWVYSEGDAGSSLVREAKGPHGSAKNSESTKL